ncbi:leucine-rich colipase-like protein 1 [Monodon monoceros]|uniref:leucine-rich colipase-like protein 1 n=1 Tax=Monodon monoceros TaxID=40151 RepID=UPI0010F50475|nr:leucine-rich colipase-like protein 1 [Monodon monoceros]
MGRGWKLHSWHPSLPAARPHSRLFRPLCLSLPSASLPRLSVFWTPVVCGCSSTVSGGRAKFAGWGSTRGCGGHRWGSLDSAGHRGGLRGVLRVPERRLRHQQPESPEVLQPPGRLPAVPVLAEGVPCPGRRGPNGHTCLDHTECRSGCCVTSSFGLQTYCTAKTIFLQCVPWRKVRPRAAGPEGAACWP